MQNIRASLGSGFQHASKTGINVDVLVFKTQNLTCCTDRFLCFCHFAVDVYWVACGFTLSGSGSACTCFCQLLSFYSQHMKHLCFTILVRTINNY